jgi:hypothetical protein
VEEIAMKKPKTMADLLAIADICIKVSEAWARPHESHGKGPRRRRKIERSTQLTKEIIKITATAVSSPQIRRRKGLSNILMTRKSGARFTAPQDMI